MRVKRILGEEALAIKGIRKRLGLTQEAFATRFGLTIATLQEWERGRRRPGPAARLLLRVIDANPDAVVAIVQSAAGPGSAP